MSLGLPRDVAGGELLQRDSARPHDQPVWSRMGRRSLTRRCSTARSTHLDSALAINTGTSAQATFIKQTSLDPQGAHADRPGQVRRGARRSSRRRGAIDVSATYFATSQAKGVSLGIWSIVNSMARLSVSDSAEIVNGAPTPTKNALPFASAKDPRVPVLVGGSATSAGRRPRTVRRRSSSNSSSGTVRSDPDGVRHRRAADRSRGEAQRERHRGHDDDPQRATRGTAQDQQLSARGDGGASDAGARRTPRPRCSSARRRSGRSAAASA